MTVSRSYSRTVLLAAVGAGLNMLVDSNGAPEAPANWVAIPGGSGSVTVQLYYGGGTRTYTVGADRVSAWQVPEKISAITAATAPIMMAGTGNAPGALPGSQVNCAVYAPGTVNPVAPVFTTFLAALAAAKAEGDKAVVVLDNTLGPCQILAGTYAMAKVRLESGSGLGYDNVNLLDGVIFDCLPDRGKGVQMTSFATTVAHLTVVSPTYMLAELDSQCALYSDTTATKPFIDVQSGATFSLDILNHAFMYNTNVNSLLIKSEAGATVQVWGFPNGSIGGGYSLGGGGTIGVFARAQSFQYTAQVNAGGATLTFAQGDVPFKGKVTLTAGKTAAISCPWISATSQIKVSVRNPHTTALTKYYATLDSDLVVGISGSFKITAILASADTINVADLSDLSYEVSL